MRVLMQRDHNHDRGAKGGTVLYCNGFEYEIKDPELAASMTEGDNPIAVDLDAPEPEPEPRPTFELDPPPAVLPDAEPYTDPED